METWLGVALGLALGFALGGALAWVVVGSRGRSAERQVAVLAARLDERAAVGARIESETAALEAEESRLRDELAAARDGRARAETELLSERRGSEERAALLRKTEESLREVFQALSAEALRRNNQSFLELARESLERFQKSAQDDLSGRQTAIGELVVPLRRSLEQVDVKLGEIEKERQSAYASLREQVEAMTRTHERLRTETAGLAQALKNPSARGRWGEIQLRRVVEIAGMLDHCDFAEQRNLPGDERGRPDLVVHLPGGKHLVVDAKIPLKAYLEAQETEDEAAREAKLDEHARQVRAHVATLGSRAYWDRFDSSPDFVVLFLPGESFFADAVRRDPELIESAVAQSVIPASPTTLISLLKAAYYGWQQERIAESAQKVRDLGSELYDRLRVLTEHLGNVGTHLDRAMDAYDRAAGSFESRVLVAARRLKDLGASTSRDLPALAPTGRTVRRLEADAPASDDVASPEGGEIR